MAFSESNISVSLPAGADLRTHQYKFVSIDSDGNVVLTADDAHADGIVQNAPNTGEPAEVAIMGVAKLACGDAVTRGGDVGSGANGAGKTAATASAVLGTALQTGADGRVISILFHPRG